ARVLAGLAVELLEQLALARRELGGHFQHDLIHRVAVATPSEMGQALAAQTELRAGLGARGHRQRGLASQHPHLYGVAQRRLPGRQRQLAQEIGALAHEDIVRLHREHDIEVAGRAAEHAALALAGEPELVAVLDAGRNRHLEELFPAYAPLTAAVLAR